MYLLDTNIVSEIRKIRAGRANPGVQAWAMESREDEMYLSVVSLMELHKGTSKNPIIRLPVADQARLVGMKARGGR